MKPTCHPHSRRSLRVTQTKRRAYLEAYLTSPNHSKEKD